MEAFMSTVENLGEGLSFLHIWLGLMGVFIFINYSVKRRDKRILNKKASRPYQPEGKHITSCEGVEPNPAIIPGRSGRQVSTAFRPVQLEWGIGFLGVLAVFLLGLISCSMFIIDALMSGPIPWDNLILSFLIAGVSLVCCIYLATYRVRLEHDAIVLSTLAREQRFKLTAIRQLDYEVNLANMTRFDFGYRYRNLRVGDWAQSRYVFVSISRNHRAFLRAVIKQTKKVNPDVWVSRSLYRAANLTQPE